MAHGAGRRTPGTRRGFAVAERSLDRQLLVSSRRDRSATRLEQALRGELRSSPGFNSSLDSRIGDAIEDIVEGVIAAAEGRAIEGAEVWRAISEAHLDPLTSESLERIATDSLEKIHQLLDGSSSEN